MVLSIQRNERVYKGIIDQLKPLLHNLPPRLVAIDGWPLAGKTTLGRYLAARFNVTLIEGDLFLLGNGKFEHRIAEVRRIVDYRLNGGSPVIVESVLALKLLDGIQRKPDFLIYVENPSASETTFHDQIVSYEKQYGPRDRANVILTIDIT